MQPQQNTPAGPPPGQPYNQMPAVQQPPQTASQLKGGQRSKGLLIALIVVSVLLVGAIGFGIWAFMERSDYKNNSDQKVSAAVAQAVEETEVAKEKEFVQREKEPFKTYQGPPQLGSVEITYPKTWSAHIDEQGQGATPLVGYMHPNFVPGLDSGTSFALQFEIVEKAYAEELESYSRDAQNGAVTVTPIKLENVDGVAGARIDGEIVRGKQGSLALFPVRDKTLKISTQTDDFKSDFDSIILKNLKFNP